MKSSKLAPYATHDEKPSVKPAVPKKAVYTPPWEKDQSSKSQSETRKTRAPVKPPPQSAPYGTLQNQPVLRNSSAITSTSKNAPFGTAENVPAFRAVNNEGLNAPPYGTSADSLKPSKVRNVISMAPWERNDSRRSYTSKTNANFGLSAPYATEPTK